MKADRDQIAEALRLAICALPRYSFLKDANENVRRVPDRTGAWIEFSAVHALLDPVEVDALLAKSAAKAAIDAARTRGADHD